MSANRTWFTFTNAQWSKNFQRENTRGANSWLTRKSFSRISLKMANIILNSWKTLGIQLLVSCSEKYLLDRLNSEARRKIKFERVCLKIDIKCEFHKQIQEHSREHAYHKHPAPDVHRKSKIIEYMKKYLKEGEIMQIGKKQFKLEGSNIKKIFHE